MSLELGIGQRLNDFHNRDFREIRSMLIRSH
jgi:hypothetical protein